MWQVRQRISDVNDYVGLGYRTADEHATRIRHIEGLLEILHLAVEQLANAALTDSRPAAEVGAQALGLGQVEQALGGRVPGCDHPRAREADLDGSGDLGRPRGRPPFLLRFKRRRGSEELVADATLRSAPRQESVVERL